MLDAMIAGTIHWMVGWVLVAEFFRNLPRGCFVVVSSGWSTWLLSISRGMCSTTESIGCSVDSISFSNSKASWAICSSTSSKWLVSLSADSDTYHTCRSPIGWIGRKLCVNWCPSSSWMFRNNSIWKAFAEIFPLFSGVLAQIRKNFYDHFMVFLERLMNSVLDAYRTGLEDAYNDVMIDLS